MPRCDDGPMSIRDDPTFAELEGRVRRLEAEVLALRQAFAPTAPPSAARWISQPPPPKGPPIAMAPLPPPAVGFPWADRAAPPPRAARKSVDSEIVLKWGGVALVVLAIGFALSTAISRGWIGPQLQLAGAVALSCALIAGGLRLRDTRFPWTHALCTGGALGLFTTVASNLFLDHVDVNVATLLTVGIAAATFGLARFVPSEWVGGAALLGGTSAWLAINRDHISMRPTILWIGALVVGAVVLSLERRWAVVRIVAQVVGLLGVVSVSHLAHNAGDRIVVLAVGAIVTAILLLVPSIKTERPAWQTVELPLPTLLGPWALGVLLLVFDVTTRHPAGAIALAVGATTACAAIVLRTRATDAHTLAVGVGASVALSIAVGLLFDAETAALLFALQGVGLIELSHRIGRRSVLLGNGCFLAGLGAILTIGHTIDAWTIDATIANDLVHVATIVAVFAGAWLVRERNVRPVASLAFLSAMLLWIGSVLVHLPQGHAAVSIAWAVVGTALLVVGATRKIARMGAAGLAVLGLTVGKLLTVDLAQVDTLWRAGLFLIVGFVLLRLGFLLPRLTKPDAPEAVA